jgi:hypothetical protein
VQSAKAGNSQCEKMNGEKTFLEKRFIKKHIHKATRRIQTLGFTLQYIGKQKQCLFFSICIFLSKR